ncbi:MAG: hypothetical protein HC831_09630 [Chloroflexia bacterium]|nr:hypothetical protein [Chloroflexia bacterium]
MQFLKFSGNVQNSLFLENDENVAAKIIAERFNISDDEYIDFAAFMSDTLYKVENKSHLLFISSNKLVPKGVHFIERKNLHGKITFLYVRSVGLYLFLYNGEQELWFNGNILLNRHLYIFTHDSVIGSENVPKIYYSELIGAFSSARDDVERIVLEAKEVEFNFRNSTNGIHH